MHDQPISNWTRINSTADRFEHDWRHGPRSRIEDHLDGIDRELRTALLKELLLVELELRRSGGETPLPEEYAARFPDDSALIMAAFTSDGEGVITKDSPPDSILNASRTTDARTGGNSRLTQGARIRYLGDYEIERELGRGGMGVVFKAWQISLDRPVALKMIRSTHLASEDERRRFRNEAESVASLDHTHIVPIYEVGRHDAEHYFSMKFIDGPSLSDTLSTFTSDPASAARPMVFISDAVHHAHQRGILHRDLKPSNILMDKQGKPHLTDFGLARRVERSDGFTVTGSIMGTPAYMAPEQAWGKGESVTTLSDVYGLGAVLYAMLTGRAPFGGETALDTLEHVRLHAPEAPSRVNSMVPRDLEVICLKCLEKDPARRYSSAESLCADLQRFLDHEPILARPVGAAERLVKWARRRPAIAGLGLALLSVAAIGCVAVIWQWRQAVSNFEEAELQRQRAVESSAEARLQRGLAEAKGREAVERADSLEKQLYINRVNLAQREWASNSSSAAGELLDLCPPRLRQWEWSYIRRLCRLASLTIGDLSRREQALRHELWKMRGLSFSPDGRRIVSADPEHRVKVWDTKRGDLLLTMPGHTDSVFTAAYSPDGRLIATGSKDCTIKLWDAAKGTLVRTLEPRGSWIRSIAFSPDGLRLVSGSGARLLSRDTTTELILWDVDSGHEIRRFAGPHDRIYGVAFRPDGRQIASVNCESSVKLWDPELVEPQRVMREHTYYIDCVTYSPDGLTLATGSRDHTAILWDVSAGRPLHVLRGHDSPIQSLAFNPDGKTLVTGDWGASVKMWNVSKGIEVAHLRASSGVSNVRFSRDGRFLAAAGGDDLITLWETGTLDNIESRMLDGHNGWCFRAQYTPDGRTLATTGWGLVKLWDATTGRLIGDIVTGINAGVHGLAIRPDGLVIATTQEQGPKEVVLWDVATRRRLRQLAGHEAMVNCVAFHPDGRILASAGEDQTIRLWDSSTGDTIAVLRGHTGRIVAVAFNPDGSLLASKGWDHTVRLWDVASRRTIRVHEEVRQKPMGHYANGVAFSPDGRTLAATRADGLVNLWDVESGAVSLTLSGHGALVNSVAFLGNRRIVTTSNDRTIKIWDASNGEAVLTLRGHSGEVLDVACRPDGTQIATAGGDGGRIWDTALPGAASSR